MYGADPPKVPGDAVEVSLSAVLSVDMTSVCAVMLLAGNSGEVYVTSRPQVFAKRSPVRVNVVAQRGADTWMFFDM